MKHLILFIYFWLETGRENPSGRFLKKGQTTVQSKARKLYLAYLQKNTSYLWMYNKESSQAISNWTTPGLTLCTKRDMSWKKEALQAVCGIPSNGFWMGRVSTYPYVHRKRHPGIRAWGGDAARGGGARACRRPRRSGGMLAKEIEHGGASPAIGRGPPNHHPVRRSKAHLTAFSITSLAPARRSSRSASSKAVCSSPTLPNYIRGHGMRFLVITANLSSELWDLTRELGHIGLSLTTEESCRLCHESTIQSPSSPSPLRHGCDVWSPWPTNLPPLVLALQLVGSWHGKWVIISWHVCTKKVSKNGGGMHETKRTWFL